MEKEALKDARRIELLNAAGELLAMQPGASLAEIAAYARIGKATLHRYFSSREALILALGFRSLELMEQAVQSSEPDKGSALEALTRIIEALVPLGDKLHFLLNEQVLDTHREFSLAQHDAEMMIRRVIERGQADGELRRDLSAEWIHHQMNYMLFATWQAVYDGFVARRDAPRMMLTTMIDGLAAR